MSYMTMMKMAMDFSEAADYHAHGYFNEYLDEEEDDESEMFANFLRSVKTVPR